MRGGFRDPRLYVDPGGLVAPRSPSEAAQLVTDARAAVLAEANSMVAREKREPPNWQVNLLGRMVTVRFKSMVLSTDGRVWEDSEMKRQRKEFVHDSISRARIGAARERIERDR